MKYETIDRIVLPDGLELLVQRVQIEGRGDWKDQVRIGRWWRSDDSFLHHNPFGPSEFKRVHEWDVCGAIRWCILSGQLMAQIPDAEYHLFGCPLTGDWFYDNVDRIAPADRTSIRLLTTVLASAHGEWAERALYVGTRILNLDERAVTALRASVVLRS